jgi:hypothetical protein
MFRTPPLGGASETPGERMDSKRAAIGTEPSCLP